MIREPDPTPPEQVLTAHLHRQEGTTKFRRHRVGSVAASLPAIGPGRLFEPDVRVNLSAEAWRKMGCPELLAVRVEPTQLVASLGEPVTAPGGVCAPWGS